MASIALRSLAPALDDVEVAGGWAGAEASARAVFPTSAICSSFKAGHVTMLTSGAASGRSTLAMSPATKCAAGASPAWPDAMSDDGKLERNRSQAASRVAV